MNPDLTDADWRLLLRFLPVGWEAAAATTGAFRRARQVPDPAGLLRLVLLWGGVGLSYRQAASLTAARGAPRLSKEAVGKRVRGTEPWLAWLLAGLLAPRVARPEPGGRRFVAVDGSSVCSARAKVQLKLHYALDLSTLTCADLRVTDVRSAEGLHQVRLQPGDVALCDRYYAKPGSLGAAHAAGAAVIARLGRTTLRLFDDAGTQLDLLAWLRELGDEPGTRAAGFREPASGAWIGGRVCAVRLSEPQAAAAREACRKAARKDGRDPQPETLEWAGYCVVFSTAADLTVGEVLAWYRARWQVELAFKRLKSLLAAGALPDVGAASARLWLTAKLVYALLLQAYLDEAGAFSPWGYPLGPAEPPLCLASDPVGGAGPAAGGDRPQRGRPRRLADPSLG